LRAGLTFDLLEARFLRGMERLRRRSRLMEQQDKLTGGSEIVLAGREQAEETPSAEELRRRPVAPGKPGAAPAPRCSPPSPTATEETSMQPTRNLLIPAIAAAMVLLATPAAMAQEQPLQPQPPMTASDFSQQQLEAFVDAATEVQRVQGELDTKAQQAQSPEEVAQLQQQAQEEASQAVEDSGLTVDEYAAIAKAANEDPQLYAMIVDLMQQRAPQ
jgi:hypothetical protein